MWVLKLLIILVAAYAAVVLVVFAAQTWLLFPTKLAGGQPDLPHGAGRVAFDTPDGERLQGIRIPSTASSDQDRTIVLGFGGNVWKPGTWQPTSMTFIPRQTSSPFITMATPEHGPAQCCGAARGWPACI
jgi:hypothetical protein